MLGQKINQVCQFIQDRALLIGGQQENYNDPVTGSLVAAEGTELTSIDFINFKSASDATNIGDIAPKTQGASGTSNGEHSRGITFGGEAGGNLTDTIDYFNLMTGNANRSFGALTSARFGATSTSNGTNGTAVTFGGVSDLSDLPRNFFSGTKLIEYTAILTGVRISNSNELLRNMCIGASASTGVGGRAVLAGGSSTNIRGDGNKEISYTNIGSNSGAIDFPNKETVNVMLFCTGLGNTSKMVVCGGLVNGGPETPLANMESIDMTNGSVNSSFGNLSHARTNASGTSNGIGDIGVVACGRYVTGGVSLTNMDTFRISSTAALVTTFGHLATGRYSMATCSTTV